MILGIVLVASGELGQQLLGLGQISRGDEVIDLGQRLRMRGFLLHQGFAPVLLRRGIGIRPFGRGGRRGRWHRCRLGRRRRLGLRRCKGYWLGLGPLLERLRLLLLPRCRHCRAAAFENGQLGGSGSCHRAQIKRPAEENYDNEPECAFHQIIPHLSRELDGSEVDGRHRRGDLGSGGWGGRPGRRHPRLHHGNLLWPLRLRRESGNHLLLRLDHAAHALDQLLVSIEISGFLGVRLLERRHLIPHFENAPAKLGPLAVQQLGAAYSRCPDSRHQIPVELQAHARVGYRILGPGRR